MGSASVFHTYRYYILPLLLPELSSHACSSPTRANLCSQRADPSYRPQKSALRLLLMWFVLICALRALSFHSVHCTRLYNWSKNKWSQAACKVWIIFALWTDTFQTVWPQSKMQKWSEHYAVFACKHFCVKNNTLVVKCLKYSTLAKQFTQLQLIGENHKHITLP